MIAENKEKFISFNVKIEVKPAGVSIKNGKKVHKNNQYRFIDSCRFMALGLYKLASNKDDDQCKHLKEFNKREEVFKPMMRKGVYPYEYIDNWEKFEEAKATTKDCILQQAKHEGIEDQDTAILEWNNTRA